MTLRGKILLYFGSFTLIIVLAIILINFYIVQNRLYKTAHQQLLTTVESVESFADSLIDGAIRNYLRGIIEQDLIVLHDLNEQVEGETLELGEAKDLFQEYVRDQKIGESGYVAATKPEGDTIILDIHPFFRGEPCPDMQVCELWIEQKNGYNSYQWQNPVDREPRQKVSYIRFFEPWDWVIGATSYEDEFYQLIEIEDFKDMISSFTILENGYIFIMDSEYNMLIHPELEGQNVYNLENRSGHKITQELVNHRGEFFYYNWTNPSTGIEELKYSYLAILEPFDWYVVATGYISDVSEPIRDMMNLSYGLVLFTAICLFLMILFFSRSLSKPLQELIQGLEDFYKSNALFKMKSRTVSEIESVGKAIEDMTEAIVKSEEDRQNILTQLDSIINSMPSMLIGIDAQEQIIFLNNKAKEFIGQEKKDTLFLPITKVLSNFQPIFESIHSSIAKGTPEHSNIKVSSKKDPQEEIFYELTVYPLATQQKAWVVRMDDVSQRVQMEDMLYHSRKMDAIGQLAGGVAHDFNNMLAGILNSLEMLAPILKENDEALSYIDIIEEASLRASELTQKLLTFSRKNAKVSTPQDVHKAMHQTLEILRRSIDKNIQIDEDLQAKNHIVVGDAAQLQSMFLNLGINASHAMPEGGKLIFRSKNLELQSKKILINGNYLDQGSYIQIEVEDSGSGIPQNIQSKVFEPFFTTKKQGEGTGLGLSSVLGVVQQHYGQLELSSSKEKGTLFVIYLPVTESKIFEMDEKILQKSTISAGVLLVEDEKIVRTVSSKMLNDLGYNCLQADDGIMALEILAAHRDEIDIILLDMIMPNMSGKDCLREIRKKDKSIPVVITSGFSQRKDLQIVQELGISSFLTKPYSMAALSHALMEALKDISNV